MVGIDSRQLYPYSLCQDMPTGLSTTWGYNEEAQTFNARLNRIGSKIWSCHTFKQPGLSAKTKAKTLQEHKKKLIASVLMVMATILRLFLKQWVVISTFSFVKKLDLA